MSKQGFKKKQASQKFDHINIVMQPGDFFKQQIAKAIQNQKITTNEHTEFYLVNLLTKFMSADHLFPENSDGKRREEVLALLMAEALKAPDAAVKQERLQRLGDVSLYTAGFFGDRLSQKVVDIDYYIGMGKNAYANLLGYNVGAFFQSVFRDLSSRFESFVDVLSEVSESTAPKNTKNLLRLYELWLKTRSPKAEKSLKDAGIIPNQMLKPKLQ